MIKCTKSVNLKCDIKSVCMMDGVLCDTETGEAVDLYGVLTDLYGDTTFDMTATAKANYDATPEE